MIIFRIPSKIPSLRAGCQCASGDARGRRTIQEPTFSVIFGMSLDAAGCSKKNKWCPGTESNRRHCDFQSHALPTELPGHGDVARSSAGRRASAIGMVFGACPAPTRRSWDLQSKRLIPAGAACRDFWIRPAFEQFRDCGAARHRSVHWCRCPYRSGCLRARLRRRRAMFHQDCRLQSRRSQRHQQLR